MNAMQSPTIRTPNPDEIDLRQVFSTLRRYAPAIILTTALATGGAYWVSQRQPRVYEASGSVLAVDNRTNNAILAQSSVAAPPLPEGAVDEALHSRGVVEDIISRLEKSTLDPALVAKIRQDLRNELADNSFNRFRIRARVDQLQRGVYEIRASAESAVASQVMAQAGVEALIAWDTERARGNLTVVRRGLQQRVQDLERRYRAAPADSVQRQALLTALSQVQEDLSQLSVFETIATGSLSIVAEPVEPRSPVAPRPLRNAALAGLLALFLSAGGALLTESLRRRVNTAEDLAALGLPVLGQLPLLRRRQVQQGFVTASRSGQLYESIGFLRINVMSLLQDRPHKRLVVSSAYPSEGKSSVTGALAESFAMTGLRVLIIDADLRRPSQLKVWSSNVPEARELVPLPGAVASVQAASTLSAAFLNPEGAHAVRVAQNVDLLPAGTGLRGSGAASILTRPNFIPLVDRWAQAYDVVLIDTPPMLGLPDTLAVAPHTDGVMLIVEAGKSRLADIERTLQNATVANVRILGFALNKISRTDAGYYGYYGYGYGGYGESESRKGGRASASEGAAS